MLITVIPFSVIALLAWVFPQKWRYRLVMPWLDVALWGCQHIMGIRYEVMGQENLDNDRVILMSKHQSTWETFFYPTYIRNRQMCYVFKRELLLVPFFGWGIGSLDMIHINRSKGRDAFEDVVSQGSKKLDEGRWIVMFPEGTRSRVGQQGKYRSGGARLAQRTGAVVIPVAVNAAEFWPKKPFTKTPGTVKVSFGPPIQCVGRDVNDIMFELESWIETEMRRLSPQYYSGPWKPLVN